MLENNIMDIMSKIRKKAKTEEFDYLFLMDCLSTYKQPKDKLSKLIKANKLIRVKKGIYVFGKEYQQRPYSLEILANLIYGPSYVSFEYALSYYNLIPLLQNTLNYTHHYQSFPKEHSYYCLLQTNS